MTATAGDPSPALPKGLLPLLTLLIFVVMMDARAMTAMLPEIASDLDASVSATGLALTAYLLAYGVFQLAYGPIADRVGAVRVMSLACILFVAVLAVGAAVSGLSELVAARLLTGAGRRGLLPARAGDGREPRRLRPPARGDRNPARGIRPRVSFSSRERRSSAAPATSARCSTTSTA